MARQQRTEGPDAWHHVMNRGARRQPIFLDDRDRTEFLTLVATAVQVFEIEVHAYCLMGNHFHLLVRTPAANLGEAMQFVGGRYTQQFNRRHQLDGALFRGRYAAVLVSQDAHLVALSRYIHQNPVEAGLVESPESWEWSSYAAYRRLRCAPSWLRTEFVLGVVGGLRPLIQLVEQPPIDLPLAA